MMQHNEGERKESKVETRERGGRWGNIRGENVAIDGENRDAVTLKVEDDDMDTPSH